MAKLTLATCYFHIYKDPKRNLQAVLRQIDEAKAGGAHLVHFSETCVSGNLGSELESDAESDWEGIEEAMVQILAAARRNRVWVVVGCNHKLSGRHKPHNSLYVINSRGELVDRYDKRFCTGDNARTGDLRHYSPGDKFVTFDIRGIRCGLLICHDFRYPELFREYKKRGVELLLASFHNAGMAKEAHERYVVYVQATMQAAAASNFFAVSANNGTRRYAWGSFVTNAEGIIIDKAPAHSPRVLVNTINTAEKLYDASAAWRGRYGERGETMTGAGCDERCILATLHNSQPLHHTLEQPWPLPILPSAPSIRFRSPPPTSTSRSSSTVTNWALY